MDLCGLFLPIRTPNWNSSELSKSALTFTSVSVDSKIHLPEGLTITSPEAAAGEHLTMKLPQSLMLFVLLWLLWLSKETPDDLRFTGTIQGWCSIKDTYRVRCFISRTSATFRKILMGAGRTEIIWTA